MKNSNPHRISRSKNLLPFLLLPALLLAVVGMVAFRTPSTSTVPLGTPSSPLVLPAGWQAPPAPADNPITSAKFVLGRYLFYETELSADGKASCSSCHNSYLSFGAGGSHSGAFGVQGEPARTVPRLMNVAYDTVLTWDGHIQTLEDQVAIAVQKPGDLGFKNGQTDTNLVFQNLASNPVYPILFQQAFGDANITLDRISKAIATFERCIISGNSDYDEYVSGEDTTLMSASAIRGMNLFFDTTKTNCSECHNNLGARGNVAGNIFTDNNYYRTGTFESVVPGVPNGGYGLDTIPTDTNIRLDAGRAAVTKDTADIGKFRTPSLRNVALHPPYGADGTVATLQQVIANYNSGRSLSFVTVDTVGSRPSNQDPRIKPLNLTNQQMSDLESFLSSLTDLSFISNPAYQDPGSPSASVDDYTISNNLSLYPNPSTGPVNIECPDFTGSVDLALISSNGATVWHKTVSSEGQLQLDLSSVANGSYRLRIRSGSTQQIVPVVLAR